ncbi:MAG: hypothetical protein AAGA09_04725 [Pseudomonadota bacterium]
MTAAPGIQGMIANMAAISKSGLSPAATGFAMGVAFTVLVLCFVLVIANSVWWASKR